MSARDLLMGADCLLAACTALLCVLTRQVVHAALWLVVTLGAVAGAFLLLGAEVVALVQLLVYVGAVVVLVLFALMLTRAPIGVSTDVDNPPLVRALAAVAGLATAGLVGATLLVAHGGTTVGIDDRQGQASGLARSLFGSWALPFELLSLLLLAALVAALALSRPVPEAEPDAGAVAEPGVAAEPSS